MPIVPDFKELSDLDLCLIIFKSFLFSKEKWKMQKMNLWGRGELYYFETDETLLSLAKAEHMSWRILQSLDLDCLKASFWNHSNTHTLPLHVASLECFLLKLLGQWVWSRAGCQFGSTVPQLSELGSALSLGLPGGSWDVSFRGEKVWGTGHVLAQGLILPIIHPLSTLSQRPFTYVYIYLIVKDRTSCRKHGQCRTGGNSALLQHWE